jgi:hypothetical protein
MSRRPIRDRDLKISNSLEEEIATVAWSFKTETDYKIGKWEVKSTDDM